MIRNKNIVKVKDLLQEYSRSFYTIEQDQTVGYALKLLSGHNVSALVVKENAASQGIFTERDLVRCHLLFPDRDVNKIPVRDVMTSKLIVAEPENTIDDAMAMMIKARIRHLPVVSDGKVNGMLCLEDLAKKYVNALTQELHYLKDYISDLQDAAHD